MESELLTSLCIYVESIICINNQHMLAAVTENFVHYAVNALRGQVENMHKVTFLRLPKCGLFHHFHGTLAIAALKVLQNPWGEV